MFLTIEKFCISRIVPKWITARMTYFITLQVKLNFSLFNPYPEVPIFLKRKLYTTNIHSSVTKVFEMG
jgi:hypothetical protein